MSSLLAASLDGWHISNRLMLLLKLERATTWGGSHLVRIVNTLALAPRQQPGASVNTATARLRETEQRQIKGDNNTFYLNAFSISTRKSQSATN